MTLWPGDHFSIGELTKIIIIIADGSPKNVGDDNADKFIDLPGENLGGIRRSNRDGHDDFSGFSRTFLMATDMVAPVAMPSSTRSAILPAALTGFLPRR